MKHLILILLSVVFASGQIFNANVSEEQKERSLETLWKEYESASKKDYVEDMTDVLEKIKEQSLKERSAWDYYKACRLYAQVKSYKNWKLWEENDKKAESEIEAYGEPVLEYLFKRDLMGLKDALAFLEKHEDRLKSARNEDVYEGAGMIYKEVLLPVVSSDYEFILWDMLARYSAWAEEYSRIQDLLKETFGDVYPQAGIMEFVSMEDKFFLDADRDLSGFRALADKYAGKALGVVANERVLIGEFEAGRESASSEYYRQIRNRLVQLIRERDSFKDPSEKALAGSCTSLDKIFDILESQCAYMSAKDGEIKVTLRNLDELKIKVFRKKNCVYEKVLQNPSGNYYVCDELTFSLPELADGDYEVVCSSGNRVMGKMPLHKYSLSAATRKDADGIALYVADYITGEPLKTVDVRLYHHDKMLAEVKGMNLNGFTRLPDAIWDKVDDGYYGYELICISEDKDGRERRSCAVGISKDVEGSAMAGDMTEAVIRLDRPVYNPGESVMFKAVVFQRFPDGTMSTAPEGCSYEARVVDSRGNVLASDRFVTNDFGSIAGEFALDDVLRNGRHMIQILDEDYEIGTVYFHVDEFVLPTYDVTFDVQEKVFFPGDDVTVSGNVKSFAGHSLASAKVEVIVKCSGDVILDETLAPDNDGRFSLSFKDVSADRYRHEYSIEVKVTDQTGETHSFTHRQSVMYDPYLTCIPQNLAEGQCKLIEGYDRVMMFDGDVMSVECKAGYHAGELVDGLPLGYRVMKGDKVVLQGDVLSGEGLALDVSGIDGGLYDFVLSMEKKCVTGEVVKGEYKRGFLILPSDPAKMVVPEEVENVFHVVDDDRITLQIGAGAAPVWAVVELFDDSKRLLKSELVYVGKGTLKTISHDWQSDYPEGVVMNVLYFRDSRCFEFTEIWRRPVSERTIPLNFTRFVDECLPGARCSVSIQSVPEVEAVASVYDIAADRIQYRPWGTVRRVLPPVGTVYMNDVSGHYSNGYYEVLCDVPVWYGFHGAYGYEESEFLAGSVRGVTMSEIARNDMPRMTKASLEPSEPVAITFDASMQVGHAEVEIRDEFSTTLTFEPFLRSDKDGMLTFDFTSSDKLSTYVVSVFAHDREMNNAVARKEILVTLPMKVSLALPQYLYSGDVYVMNASVSNVSDADLGGTVMFEVYDGESYEGADPVMREVVGGVVAPAHGSVAVPFEIKVPEGVDTLGIKVVFAGEGLSDGIFVTVPVSPAAQVIREAHSAVLLSGMSEESVLQELRYQFVNGSASGAEHLSVSVMDMLKEALPLVVQADGKDAVSQSEALYVNLLAAGLREGEDVSGYVGCAADALAKVLSCANADGGFGWFSGMKSSPVVTALILERYAGLKDRGLLDMLGTDAAEVMASAVKYLDSVYFADLDRPEWYGALSLWQYLNVRTMYPEVDFNAAAARKAAGSKGYQEFLSEVKGLLVPKDGNTWTNGAILNKVRMIRVLRQLSSSDEGRKLAGTWGVPVSSKMDKSIGRELKSLKQYAVEHPSGGIYYPNAVLPWRGLMESEAYAHASIADLFRDLSEDAEYGSGLEDMADGICLWIMLQKETQQWSSDPSFVEAMASVYDASAAVKDTKVIVLSKRFMRPFDTIDAAGNGFRISVRYYRDGKELSAGDVLHVGDKVTAKCSVWSEENRSFVRISVPRPACMRPCEQLSGWTGGWFRPLSYSVFSISPYAYREVKSDRTLYWVDTFPEEESTLEEEWFVTQEGVFTSPVAEVESIYAPHYIANDAFRGNVTTSAE